MHSSLCLLWRVGISEPEGDSAPLKGKPLLFIIFFISITTIITVIIIIIIIIVVIIMPLLVPYLFLITAHI